jgi:hypothetical protein
MRKKITYEQEKKSPKKKKKKTSLEGMILIAQGKDHIVCNPQPAPYYGR